MPTKDPHVALIDAHEKLHRIKMQLQKAVMMARSKTLTKDDLLIVEAIRQEAIDATRRVQDELYEELESHERQGRAAV